MEVVRPHFCLARVGTQVAGCGSGLRHGAGEDDEPGCEAVGTHGEVVDRAQKLLRVAGNAGRDLENAFVPALEPAGQPDFRGDRRQEFAVERPDLIATVQFLAVWSQEDGVRREQVADLRVGTAVGRVDVALCQSPRWRRRLLVPLSLWHLARSSVIAGFSLESNYLPDRPVATVVRSPEGTT